MTRVFVKEQGLLRQRWLVPVALQIGLIVASQSAWADTVVEKRESTTITSAAEPETASAAPDAGATSTTTTAATATTTPNPDAPGTAVTTTSATTATTTSSAPAAAAAASDGPLVEPGPAEARRTALIMRIFNAKAQGIGIDAYLNAFAMMENSVKTGATEADLNKRIDSINSSLDDQLKRSALLKIQKPAPPVAASGFPAGGLGNGSSSGGTSDLIRKLQEKYGNQIPPGLKEKFGGQIPDNLKDKIPAGLGGMDPSQLEDLIKKYKK